jgi:hypothetical protein
VSNSASTDGLREMIRDSLRELLPGLTAPGDPSRIAPPFEGRSEPISVPAGDVEVVNLRTDADLGAFVTRLLRLFENPKSREDLRAGRIRFRLTESSVPGSFQPVHRVESGAVTEATVKEAARSGAKLVLGPRAVLTPLARDRARSTGVHIEREQQ